jgi:hypothetical protein
MAHSGVFDLIRGVGFNRLFDFLTRYGAFIGRKYGQEARGTVMFAKSVMFAFWGCSKTPPFSGVKRGYYITSGRFGVVFGKYL